MCLRAVVIRWDMPTQLPDELDAIDSFLLGVDSRDAQRPSRNDDSDADDASSEDADAAAMLAAAGHASADTEFFSPMPRGYKRGRHRFVVVFGTVMSGLGKGIFASSLAKLLQDKGLVVAPVKLEGYLNIDSGTLNPYRHGEVFVLADGTECDMDLGTYERMLDHDLSRSNFMTSGQVFSEVLRRERHGGYLGRDVQMIPHVTGEVKRRIREVAVRGDGQNPADVVFVEVGGTVGDYENGFYIEALRELAFEEGPDSCCFVALTYVIEPKSLGEQKSKAAQLGIKRLMEAGVQPHIIACRATHACSNTVLQKIAMFSNVPMRRVFSLHDRESIYAIPSDMRQAGLDREVLSILSMHDRVNSTHEDRLRAKWTNFASQLLAPHERSIDIGISGKYASLRDAYASIDKALEHCSAHLGCSVSQHWLDAEEMTESSVAEHLENLDGVIVPGGFGARGVDGKINVVRHCRENGLPYLGICLGFQVAVIEFARNVLGIEGAGSTETDQACAEAVISELPDQKRIEGLGGTMRLGAQDVVLAEGSLASFLHGGAKSVRERFRHRYEVDPSYIERLEEGGLVFSGRHPVHPIMQVLEFPIGSPGSEKPRHPFFLAAQFHPELTSRPLHPQPFFMGLVAACLVRKYALDPAEDSTLARWVQPNNNAQHVG